MKQYGPTTSADLIARLVETGMTAAAARQRISRGRESQFKRLAGIRLAKNARFLYLEDQYGSPDFWTALEKAFKVYGPSYWAAVNGLRARGGLCPVGLFPTISCAPLARKRQLSPDRILQRLIEINLLEVVDVGLSEKYIQFKPFHYKGASIERTRSILLAESIALQGMKDWLRRVGFASFNKVLLRGDEKSPVVSGLTWDLSAPSYIRPLVSAPAGKLKHGFVVCDINLESAIDENAVVCFLRKHDMASAPAGVGPIMPFLVADVFTQKGFDVARSKGILATTTQQLFGREIADSIRALITLFSDLGATASINPKYLEEVLSNLTKIHGAADRIRGGFFELIIGMLVKDVEEGFLRTGVNLTHIFSGAKAQVDVILDQPDAKKMFVLECKSKIATAVVSMSEVKRWYESRVPLIYDILSYEKRHAGKAFRFELWTNGFIDPEALGWLKEQKQEFDGYSVGWREGPALKKYADKAKEPSIRKMLQENYFNHPLS